MPLLQTLQARLVATSNIALSGVGQPLDDRTINEGDVIFTPAQTVMSDRGLWVAAAAGWTRDTSFDTAAEMLKGTLIFVTDGSGDNKNSVWSHTTDGAIGTVGSTPGTSTTALSFQRELWGQGAAQEGTGIARSGAAWNLTATGVPEGTYGGLQVDTEGRVQDAVSTETATTFVEGLKVNWVSANALEVEPGSAYVPGLGKVVELPLGASLTGLTLTANTFYYLYLFESGGAGQMELVTAVPDDPYHANARTKGGATPSENHRLIKTLRASAANTLLRWRKDGDKHMHLADWQTTAATGGLLIHNAARISATNNTPLDTDLSPLVPPHCRVAEVQGWLIFGTGGTTAWLRHSGDTTKSRAIGVVRTDSTRPPFTMLVETDASRHIEAVQDGGNFTDITLACTGFIEEV